MSLGQIYMNMGDFEASCQLTHVSTYSVFSWLIIRTSISQRTTWQTGFAFCRHKNEEISWSPKIQTNVCVEIRKKQRVNQRLFLWVQSGFLVMH